MKFPWLEEMVKQGSVSAAARDEMMAECDTLLKVAIDVTHPDYIKFMEQAKPFATAASAILAGAGWLLWPKMRDASEIKKTIADIAKNKAEIIAMPEYQEHRDIASARFDEITQLAPSVARNKPFMLRLIKDKLHSGLTDHDAQTLSSIQATYTPRISMQKKMQEKTAARRGELVADMVILTKEAGATTEVGASIAKNIGRGFLLATPMAALAAGTGGVRHLLAIKDSKVLAQRQAEAFEEALRMSDPEREPLHENKERARQAFKTLVHFAPHVAADPQAARAFMNRLVSYNQGVDLSSVKDLSEIERNMAGKGVSPFFSGMAAGAKAFGLDKAMEGAVGSALAPAHHQITEDVATSMGMDYHSKAFNKHVAHGE